MLNPSLSDVWSFAVTPHPPVSPPFPPALPSAAPPHWLETSKSWEIVTIISISLRRFLFEINDLLLTFIEFHHSMHMFVLVQIPAWCFCTKLSSLCLPQWPCFVSFDFSMLDCALKSITSPLGFLIFPPEWVAINKFPAIIPTMSLSLDSKGNGFLFRHFLVLGHRSSCVFWLEKRERLRKRKWSLSRLVVSVTHFCWCAVCGSLPSLLPCPL